MRMAVKELVKKTLKKSAKTVGIYFRDGSSRLSLNRTFKDLVLVVFLHLRKRGVRTPGGKLCMRYMPFR